MAIYKKKSYARKGKPNYRRYPPSGKKLRAMRLAKRPVFKRAVKKIVHSMAENKMAYHTTSDSQLTYFNSTIASTGDILQIVPNITVGDEENQRDGDSITAQSLTVKGYVRFTPVQTAGDIKFSQVGVRLMCVSLKKSPSWDLAAASSTPLLSLLKRGGTTVGFSGQLSDLYNPINTDLFTVHGNKVFYLTQNNNSFATNVGYWSTDVKDQIRFFTFNLKCKDKKLLYDDDTNSGLLPTNYAPFLLVGYVYLNGTVGDTLVSNLGMQYQSILKFEDI